MPSADAAGVAEEGQSPGGSNKVSFSNNDPTVIGGGDDDDGSSSSPQPVPLYNSSRLKGYITLFVSALYNFLAAAERSNVPESDDLSCLSLDNLGSIFNSVYTPHRLNFAMACSMITVIITFVVILGHLDFCTPLRKNVWPKAFGPQSTIELAILLSLTLFWFISTWFNTTIGGPAGEGNNQYNLYFSNWTCCWACFWTLERWCTASGRASFERFVKSWPNRCPMWILTFMLSMADFLFVLDAYRNWEEGTRFNPYVHKLYSEVHQAQWLLMFFITTTTFLVSFAWVLAEIFRESRMNVESLKSDVETYVEGITAHILTLMWIVTVCIVTMPGGLASLLGNLYFATWGTLFAVISTLIWYLYDWRQEIKTMIREEERKYERTKADIRRREERRLERLAEKEAEESKAKSSETNMDKLKAEDDADGVLCQDDPVDDDITISITSDYNRPQPGSAGASSIASGDWAHGPQASRNASARSASDSANGASLSVFASVLFFFYRSSSDDRSTGSADQMNSTKQNPTVATTNAR